MADLTNFSWTGTGRFQGNLPIVAIWTFNCGSIAGSVTSAPNLRLNTGSTTPIFTTGSWFNTLDFGDSTTTLAATTLNIASNLILSSQTGGAYTNLSINAVGTGTITPNGKTLAALTINTAGTVTLAAAMTVSGAVSISKGTLNTSSFTLTSSTFYCSAYPGTSANLSGSSTYNITGSGSNAFVSSIGSTSLLLSTQNSGNYTTDSSSNALTITNNNTAAFNSLTPLSGIGSILFDGTTQYLTAPSTANGPLDLVTGAPDWAIECWFNLSSIPTSGAIFWKPCGTPNPIGIWVRSGGIVQWLTSDSSAGDLTVTVSTGVWYHIAFVKTGSNISVYLNGSRASSATIGTLSDDFTSPFYIGNSSDNRYFPGYISNFRVTKGIPVYNGSFTVPTSPLSAWNSSSGSPLVTTGVTLNLSSASAKTFAGGGGSYSTLNQGGAGALTIAGNNSFANLTATTRPSTLSFTAGSTQTFTTFTLSGTAGNLVTLTSTIPGTSYTLTRPTGVTSVDYLSLTDSSATSSGTGSWYAGNNSLNISNNAGWIFGTYSTAQFFNFFFFN